MELTALIVQFLLTSESVESLWHSPLKVFTHQTATDDDALHGTRRHADLPRALIVHVIKADCGSYASCHHYSRIGHHHGDNTYDNQRAGDDDVHHARQLTGILSHRESDVSSFHKNTILYLLTCW